MNTPEDPEGNISMKENALMDVPDQEGKYWFLASEAGGAHSHIIDHTQDQLQTYGTPNLSNCSFRVAQTGDTPHEPSPIQSSPNIVDESLPFGAQPSHLVQPIHMVPAVSPLNTIIRPSPTGDGWNYGLDSNSVQSQSFNSQSQLAHYSKERLDSSHAKNASHGPSSPMKGSNRSSSMDWSETTAGYTFNGAHDIRSNAGHYHHQFISQGYPHAQYAAGLAPVPEPQVWYNGHAPIYQSQVTQSQGVGVLSEYEDIQQVQQPQGFFLSSTDTVADFSEVSYPSVHGPGTQARNQALGVPPQETVPPRLYVPKDNIYPAAHGPEVPGCMIPRDTNPTMFQDQLSLLRVFPQPGLGQADIVTRDSPKLPMGALFPPETPGTVQNGGHLNEDTPKLNGPAQRNRRQVGRSWNSGGKENDAELKPRKKRTLKPLSDYAKAEKASKRKNGVCCLKCREKKVSVRLHLKMLRFYLLRVGHSVCIPISQILNVITLPPAALAIGLTPYLRLDECKGRNIVEVPHLLPLAH